MIHGMFNYNHYSSLENMIDIPNEEQAKKPVAFVTILSVIFGFGCYELSYIITPMNPWSSSIGSRTHPFGRRCDYAAELLNLDKQFERILSTVSALGAEDDTLVCFASDHGQCSLSPLSQVMVS